jgi:hypothetical protein
MAPTSYQVKNKLNVALTLSDGAGDSVQIPPLSTHSVDARFIDFQLPALAEAEVLNYDYGARLAKAAPPAPPPPPPKPSSPTRDEQN